MRGSLDLPFSSLIFRGNLYDIAELARMMAHSVYNRPLRQILECKNTKDTIYIPMQVHVSMIIRENEITIPNRINIRLDDVKRYTKLALDMRDIAQVFSSPANGENNTVTIELHGCKDTIHRLLDRESTYVIYLTCNSTCKISYVNSVEYALALRTASLKGILRYALLKLTIVYSLYYLIRKSREINIRDILRVLALYAYIMTYSNHSFIFPSENIIHLREVLKRDIIVLPSVIFGSGTNRSLILLEYVDKDFGNITKYIIRVQENAILNKMIFSKILNKFKDRYSYTDCASIRRLLYGLLCLIVGSLNYIHYLNGPLIPIFPGYLREEGINRVISFCRLPSISSHDEIKEVIEIADSFLKFYVEEYILKSLGY